ncbi:hypothetical protein HK405_002713, partial [Cladochytrium tenue]
MVSAVQAASAAGSGAWLSSLLSSSPPRDAAGLKPISFTYVLYDPADLLGKPLAAASLVPQALVVAYIA